MSKCRGQWILLLLLGSWGPGLGCDRAPAKAPVPIEKVAIVATVYPLADIARNVGGPYVSASWLIESGQSLSGVQSNVDLRNRLRSADQLQRDLRAQFHQHKDDLFELLAHPTSAPSSS